LREERRSTKVEEHGVDIVLWGPRFGVVTVPVVSLKRGFLGTLAAGVDSDFVLVVPQVFLRQIRRADSVFLG